MSEPVEAANEGVRTIAAVDNCCTLLELLFELDGAGVSELSRRCSLTKGAVHTQLQTLLQNGYVTKDGTEYSLSLSFLNRGHGIRQSLPVYQAAQDELSRLAAETGENAHLMVEQNGVGYIVDKAAGEKAAPTTSHVGKRLHLHYTSTGKAILAVLPKDRVETIIDQQGLPTRTDNTVVSRDTLHAELAEIRERGVAFDRGEQLEQARCVGCPIMAPDGSVAGAISVSGPRSRLTGEYFESTLPNMVRDAANSIEMNLEIDESE
jgi:DNA-binding IclR family transcriptional regulator